jgi:hypothetical protein
MERAPYAAMTVTAVFVAGLAALPVTIAPGGPAQAIPVHPVSSGPSQGLLATRGPSWTVSKPSLPSGAGAGAAATLSGVACPSALVCLAVGDYLDSSGSGQGLLLAGHGSSWTATRAPLPAGAAQPGGAGPAVSLGFVACPSASVCVAVGGYTDSSGNQQGLLLATRGSSWTATKAPLPAGAATNPNADLPDVACPSASACVAVGSYTDSSGNQQGLLLATRGSSWTATKVPLPAGAAASAAASLSAVACPSVAACAAAGMYTNSSGRAQGLLLATRGSSWTASRAPLPGSAPAGWLASVACPSTATCAAAGDYATSLDVDNGLLLATRGSSWTATKAPLPAGAAVNADANLPGHDLACPSTSSCVAAGSYLGASGYTQGLLLASRGSSWTATKAPLPAGAKAGWLASVACPSAAVCVAAGQYYDRSGNWQGLLLAGRGSSWTVIKAPLPAGAATSPSPWVPGVACPSAATCVAAGYYTDAAGYPQGMLLTGPG